MRIRTFPRLLGLTGHKFSGKDTTATMMLAMADGAGFDAEGLSLSQVIYEEVAQAFGIQLQHLLSLSEHDDTGHPELALRHCSDKKFLAHVDKDHNRHLSHAVPREGRHVIRWWAKYRRAEDPNYLLNVLQARINHLRASGIEHIIVRDIRRPAEAEWLRAQGGQVWCVWCVKKCKSADLYMSALSPERQIPNNGDLNRLRLVLRDELASL